MIFLSCDLKVLKISLLVLQLFISDIVKIKLNIKVNINYNINYDNIIIIINETYHFYFKMYVVINF